MSLFAIQFAQALGARVIATTGSPLKAQRLRDLGADEVIDYRENPDWFMAVRALTGGRGVDRIIEVAGTLHQSLRSVAIEGHVAFVGSVSGRLPPLDPGALFAAAATVRAVAVGNRDQFAAMNQYLAAREIRPVTDRVFPFEEAVAAYRYYETTSPCGKVVIFMADG